MGHSVLCLQELASVPQSQCVVVLERSEYLFFSVAQLLYEKVTGFSGEGLENCNTAGSFLKGNLPPLLSRVFRFGNWLRSENWVRR